MALDLPVNGTLPTQQPAERLAGAQKEQTVPERLRAFFTSKLYHLSVVVLVTIDLCFILADLGILLTHCNQEEMPHNLEAITESFAWVSIAILALFLLEFALQLILFGPRWLLAWGHALDVIVVSVSFVLELVFKSTELEELLGLLVFARLWRLMRVVYTSGQLDELEHENKMEQLQRHNEQLQRELQAAQGEAAQLRQRLQRNSGGGDGKESSGAFQQAEW